MDEKTTDENTRAEYQEVCNNFRLLTDIRFKLIALLPIGTGAGVALTIGNGDKINSPLIGLFGLVITASAAIYNLRNDQLYNELVATAADLERQLGRKRGAFAYRLRDWRRAGPFRVSHDKIWWIYFGSLSAWLFTILHGIAGVGLKVNMETIKRSAADSLLWAGVEAVIAIALVLLAASLISRQKMKEHERLKDAVKAGVRAIKEIPMSASLAEDNWREALMFASKLAGGRGEKSTKRHLAFYLSADGAYYWDQPASGEKFTDRSAADLLGLLTDMPTRWILDVATGRRG